MALLRASVKGIAEAERTIVIIATINVILVFIVLVFFLFYFLVIDLFFVLARFAFFAFADAKLGHPSHLAMIF
jgi:hypothetical protein